MLFQHDRYERIRNDDHQQHDRKNEKCDGSYILPANPFQPLQIVLHLRENRESDRTEYIADKRRSYILILVGLSIVTGLRHTIKLTDDNGIYLVKHIVDNTRNDQVGTISEKLTQRSHAKYPSGTPVVKHPEKNSPEKREAERLSHQRPDSHTAVSHHNGDDRSDTQRPQIDTSAHKELEMLQQQSLLYKGKCIQRNHEKQNPADIYQIRDFKKHCNIRSCCIQQTIQHATDCHIHIKHRAVIGLSSLLFPNQSRRKTAVDQYPRQGDKYRENPHLAIILRRKLTSENNTGDKIEQLLSQLVGRAPHESFRRLSLQILLHQLSESR